MHALVDKFGRTHRYLRLSLTDRCNMACNYCMPCNGFAGETSRTASHMTADEILRICGIFVNRCGIKKIRLTGGEPLVRSDFAQVAEAVSSLPVKQIGITTNGVLLQRHESTLIRNRVNLWNLSLDTLQGEKFELISNRPRSFWDRTMKAVHRAIDLEKSGTIDSVKINTVMMRNVNDDEIIDFVNLTRDNNIQLRFIEFMPFSGNSFSSKILIPKRDILNTITESFGSLEAAEQESKSSSTGSDVWRVPGYRGTFGVISSMTDSFCGSCDRVRLTADGKVRNCLFSASGTEVSLLDILRRGGSDDEIEAAIRGNVDAKKFAHGGKHDVEEIRKLATHSRPMIEIGG